MALTWESHAASLLPSDSVPGTQDYFGTSVDISGTTGLVGAYYDGSTGTSNAGAAYIYRDLADATGTETQNTRLNSSTPTANEFFGVSSSIEGSLALVGTNYTNSNRGAVYVFQGLGASTPSVQTQSLTLSLTGAATNTAFGRSVSLSGTNGLVGASGNTASGNAAYLYRGLNTATGNPNPTAKLVATGAAASAGVGTSVSLSGSLGLVGVTSGDKAYFYRGLDTATGNVTQAAELIRSTSSSNSGFGRAVSLDGGSGLVGAAFERAVYLYRNLDTNANASITQNARLVASSSEAITTNFGFSVGISGENGIVGANQEKVGVFNNAGAVFLFTDLDAATGNSVYETVKVSASDAGANNYFGTSVAIDGDNFIIGARGASGVAGKAIRAASVP